MDVFANFSPDVEALSLDEAFLDMTGSEQLFGDPESMGRRLKDAIREGSTHCPPVVSGGLGRSSNSGDRGLVSHIGGDDRSGPHR